MKFFRIYIALLIGLVSNGFLGCHVYAQCDEMTSHSQRYLLSHSLNLDPIEGEWNVIRTVKIYQGKQLKRIKKEENAEVWLVLKQENHFIVCTGNGESNVSLVFFTKDQSSKYVFNKNYSKQNAFVSAYAKLVGEKLTFAYFENVNYLMDLLGSKYKGGVGVEYEYEMVKITDYANKISNQVPKIKNFIIQGVKNYFNL